MRELFAGRGIELDFEREEVAFAFDTADEALDEYATKFGPIVVAKAALEPQGKWDAPRADLLALFRRNEADAGVRFSGEYLVVRGAKPV